jgi:hypothetical protein
LPLVSSELPSFLAENHYANIATKFALPVVLPITTRPGRASVSGPRIGRSAPIFTRQAPLAFENMAVVNDVQRPEYLFIGTETEILWSKLDFLRSTLLWKCEGLDEDQLSRRSVLPSELSLLDLMSHLTGAERYWFQTCLLGSIASALENETHPGDPMSPQEVLDGFLGACADSRRIVAEHSLEEVVPSVVFGCSVNLRFIAVHMIEEYSRHCGHADLLRETIDGAVGE